MNSVRPDLTRRDIIKLIASYNNNHMRGFDLQGVRLDNEDLSNLNLSGFNFTNASLKNCNFTGANFRSMTSVAFKNADVTGGIFNEAHRQYLNEAIGVDSVSFV